VWQQQWDNVFEAPNLGYARVRGAQSDQLDLVDTLMQPLVDRGQLQLAEVVKWYIEAGGVRHVSDQPIDRLCHHDLLENADERPQCDL
jgi:hypothetical protein